MTPKSVRSSPWTTRQLASIGANSKTAARSRRKSKNGAVRKSPKRQPATPKPAPQAVEEAPPVAISATDDELADDIADVPVGEPDVTELAHDECLLLAGSLSDLRHHLEPQSLRGIICDNPLKPGPGRKPKTSVISPEALQHYKDIAKLAAQTLEPDGILAVPVRTGRWSRSSPPSHHRFPIGRRWRASCTSL